MKGGGQGRGEVGLGRNKRGEGPWGGGGGAELGGATWSCSCLRDVGWVGGWEGGLKRTRAHNCRRDWQAGAQVNIMALAHVHAHAEKSQT